MGGVKGTKYLLKTRNHAPRTTRHAPHTTRHAPRKTKNSVPPLFFEKAGDKKIQLEAARIATGTTKLVSVQKLYNEIGWETLDDRRRKHKLVLFYKMYNDIAPSCFSSLVPRPDENT